MHSLWQILVASSDLENLQRVSEILNKHGLDPICTSTISQCREIMAQENVGLVFCDRDLRDGGYRDLLAAAAYESTRGRVRVVLISSVVDSDEYDSAKRSGLFDVIAAPCRPTDVEWMVIRAKRDEYSRTRRLASATFGLSQSTAN
jgi:DNA-binding NtrC family response regulator